MPARAMAPKLVRKGWVLVLVNQGCGAELLLQGVAVWLIQCFVSSACHNHLKATVVLFTWASEVEAPASEREEKSGSS